MQTLRETLHDLGEYGPLSLIVDGSLVAMTIFLGSSAIATDFLLIGRLAAKNLTTQDR